MCFSAHRMHAVLSLGKGGRLLTKSSCNSFRPRRRGSLLHGPLAAAMQKRGGAQAKAMPTLVRGEPATPLFEPRLPGARRLQRRDSARPPAARDHAARRLCNRAEHSVAVAAAGTMRTRHAALATARVPPHPRGGRAPRGDLTMIRRHRRCLSLTRRKYSLRQLQVTEFQCMILIIYSCCAFSAHN